ncbi:NAD(P)/FAD-dependent oxidoreductase [Streptomyces sp. NPDC050803]|uniref:FAD-dependent oxidoreductase n=1 Tax=unclassified Streptomyces TaxID=2593676 RepID=UPI00342D56E0
MTDLPDHTDVLVVGAGPTGLVLGCVLASANIPFVLVDRVTEGGNYSRAVGTLPRSLEMLDQVKLGKRLADAGNHARRIKLFSGDRNRRIAALQLHRLPTDYPYATVMPQHHAEEIILTRLRELGADVHRPVTLSGLTQDAAGATAVLRGPEGEERTVRAKYVVGADGSRSDVREQAGIDFPGTTFRQSFVLADMRLTDGPPANEIHLFFSRHGAVVMGHMPDDAYRVCISVDHWPGSQLTGDQARELLEQRSPNRYRPTIIQVLNSSRTLVHHRIATRFRSGRVLLAGDAAHTNSPIIGQGMNLGMQDGITLGNALVDTLSSGVDSLDAYERVRRPIAREAVGITRLINRIGTERNRVVGLVRDSLLPISGLPPVNRQMTNRLSRLVDR